MKRSGKSDRYLDYNFLASKYLDVKPIIGVTKGTSLNKMGFEKYINGKADKKKIFQAGEFKNLVDIKVNSQVGWEVSSSKEWQVKNKGKQIKGQVIKRYFDCDTLRIEKIKGMPDRFELGLYPNQENIAKKQRTIEQVYRLQKVLQEKYPFIIIPDLSKSTYNLYKKYKEKRSKNLECSETARSLAKFVEQWFDYILNHPVLKSSYYLINFLKSEIGTYAEQIEKILSKDAIQKQELFLTISIDENLMEAKFKNCNFPKIIEYVEVALEDINNLNLLDFTSKFKDAVDGIQSSGGQKIVSTTRLTSKHYSDFSEACQRICNRLKTQNFRRFTGLGVSEHGSRQNSFSSDPYKRSEKSMRSNDTGYSNTSNDQPATQDQSRIQLGKQLEHISKDLQIVSRLTDHNYNYPNEFIKEDASDQDSQFDTHESMHPRNDKNNAKEKLYNVVGVLDIFEPKYKVLWKELGNKIGNACKKIEELKGLDSGEEISQVKMVWIRILKRRFFKSFILPFCHQKIITKRRQKEHNKNTRIWVGTCDKLD